MEKLEDEHGFNWPHLTITLILCFFGLTMLYSASSVIAFDKFGDSFYYLKKQAIIFASSLLFLYLFSQIDYEYWLKFIPVLGVLTLLLMIAPLASPMSHSAGGGARWIQLGSFQFQPSEWGKVVCILTLSAFYLRYEKHLSNWKKGFVIPIAISLVFAALCLFQPDLGNACLMVVVTLVTLYIVGAQKKHLAYFAGLSLIPLTLLLVSAPYRMRRLLSFWRPWEDPENTSYQIVQSFMALSRGGVFGEGVGNSHGKLYYLPEAQTDFIASIIGEELGVVGIFFLTLAFLYFLQQSFHIAKNSKRKSGFYVASFLGILLGLEIFGNLFVISGLLPTKGLPLPFLSQGGSSLLCSLICCGIIQSVAKYGHKRTLLKNAKN